MSILRILPILWLLPALAAACGDDGTTPVPDGGLTGVHARFDLAADPMPYGAIPYPDDLYLDESGHVAIGELPGESRSPDTTYHDSLRVGLADLDGFGAVTPAFFLFDGALDPASLPATPEMSLLEDASVFMLNVDPESSAAFDRVPVEVSFYPATQQLAVRPANGHPLRAGRRYVVVVTTDVMDVDGAPITPAPAFAEVRDALTRPDNPLLGEAWDHYNEVLMTLGTNGVTRDRVAALAHFHVQTITEGLADARTIIWADDAPTPTVTATYPEGAALDGILGTPAMDVIGLEVEGGVKHDALSFMIHGTFESPWFLSDDPAVHGRFSRDGSGDLIVHRTSEVPFTLFLPRTADFSDLPVVIAQHGLGAERSNELAFADSLCREGYAVLAMDLPWHGMRNPATEDLMNRFTGEMTPDGFGDKRGLDVVIEFAGIFERDGELAAFHPNYLRDALRQGAADLMTFVRMIRAGDWSEVRAADASLDTLSFSAEPISLIGYSLGGIVATQFATMEPEIGVAVLAVTGGNLMELVANGPIYNRGYFPLLLPKLGLDPRSIDYEALPPRFMPELAIWQTLLDRGDSIAYGNTLYMRPMSILMPMARNDENLHNIGTESLARAIGAEMVADEPLYADLSTTTAPVRDNVTIEGETVTRAVYAWQPATHLLMLQRQDEDIQAHPVAPPFPAGDHVTVDNPIDDAMNQTVHFLQSFRTGTAEVVGPRTP